ncbi:hypothetical protein JOQ06_022987 [Pogonophryne albipinna]|uniref:Immunoglobulin V-set domain-containing protein n=1 Tax=Pogonophryne albipinna TaxID=1090488 RepID=A0AAD6AAL8_9TELE|nr:hypothetical protein JOQ06_022987 [Pogonophryne albipinna]
MLSSLMFLIILTGVSCEDLTALQREEFSPEGSTVTLSYRYSKVAELDDYFFWYRQYPGKPPEFLIFHLGTQNATNSRLSVKPNEDKTQIYLSISSAAVTDSAVFYCAVQPTVTGNTTTLYKNLCSFSLNIHTLQILFFLTTSISSGHLEQYNFSK